MFDVLPPRLAVEWWTLMLNHPWPRREPTFLPPQLPHHRFCLGRAVHAAGESMAVRSYSSCASYMDPSQKLCLALKACREIGLITEARRIHACIFTSGFATSTFLQNHLLGAYSACGSLEDAHRVFCGIRCPNAYSWNAMISGFSAHGRLRDARSLFNRLPQRDIVSWNTMMAGCFLNGEFVDAVKLFVHLVRDTNLDPNSITLSCTMKACGAIGCRRLGVQLHSFVVKFGFASDQGIEASVLDMYVKCEDMDCATRQFELTADPNLFCWNSMILVYARSLGPEDALELFYQMPQRNIVSWNTMISTLSQHGRGIEALRMFIIMNEERFKHDSVGYASVLGACTSIPAVEWGRHLHARIIRLHTSVNVFIGGALVDMYAKCGYLGTAKQVFDVLSEQNVVSWTSLIGGYGQFGYVVEAMMLFNQMRVVPLSPDEFTFVTVLGACSTIDYLGIGIQLHSLSIKMGHDVSPVVANAICAMYAKSGNVHNADSIFHSMPIRNVISWTTMITAYSQMGDHVNALALFRRMPERNVVTWNALLASHVRNGHREEGLKMYILMLREATVWPDWITFTILFSMCADLGALRLGNQLISQLTKFGFDSDVSVANGIIAFYSKSGRIVDAEEVFYSITEKNLISWNTMISGYGQNGLGKKAVETFENMLLTDTEPDHITYVAILSACSHSGLISEGKFYFDFMVRHHKISPGSEHLACMVDLLGRAGLLEEAKIMIDEMETEPTSEIWGALLNACKIYGNTKLAENAVKHLLELDVKHSGSYVLLANIYSDSGKSDDAAGVRKLMKDRGIRKEPGCSWLEVNNRIHAFVVNNLEHPQIENILITLDEVVKKIQTKGYVNQMGSQSPHSEKLAITFGLTSLPNWMPIHIMKNLRICVDCHNFAKFISSVFTRELVIRDTNRFHHFKEGLCSCSDYW
ncbi:hypothetical protein Taro_015073 [Colocasia esculenta]|uniref:DYW domain-containing protein n=1 Tax=Colocasia esculenta TaxID=4460 RepID=A0A843UAL6_COLES|nr:hypothetical protein [Colocasia esculenta]